MNNCPPNCAICSSEYYDEDEEIEEDLEDDEYYDPEDFD